MEGSKAYMTAESTIVPAFRPCSGDPSLFTSEEVDRITAEYCASRSPRLRDTLVLYHQRLVRSIAARFIGGEETIEDLMQIGNIGLINALDRFDPGQGTRLSTFATPTILGEIRRHFRDKAAGIKLPRWLQERQSAVRKANRELILQLGRAGSIPEVAEHLHLTEEEVLVVLESQQATDLMSLDSHLESASAFDTSTLGDLIGRIDQALAEFEKFGDLRNALGNLTEREREVIALRFFDEMSQATIAQKLNISQMHVSRLQQRALRQLRDLLEDEPVQETHAVYRR
jgi:RNA polymerase sigma-B factor